MVIINTCSISLPQAKLGTPIHVQAYEIWPFSGHLNVADRPITNKSHVLSYAVRTRLPPVVIPTLSLQPLLKKPPWEPIHKIDLTSNMKTCFSADCHFGVKSK